MIVGRSMIRRAFLSIGVVTALAAGVGCQSGAGVRTVRSPTSTRTSTHASIDSWSSIVAACGHGVDAQGFGNVTVDHPIVLHNVTGVLPTPCKLHLAARAGLTLTHSNLLTDKLVLMDDESSISSPRVDIVSSYLHGGATAGLQISLHGHDTQVQIEDSTLTYPLSIGIGMDTDDDHSSLLSIVHSKLTSVGTSSEGILASTTARGVFTADTFVVNPGDENLAVLYAQSCEQHGNTGATPRCQAE